MRKAVDVLERGPAHRGLLVFGETPAARLGRLLHDRTADKIAAVVSRIPRCAATIVPSDVQSRVRVLQDRQMPKAPGAAPPRPVIADRVLTAEQEMRAVRKLRDLVKGREAKDATAAEEKVQSYERPKPPPGVKLIGSLTDPGKVTVEGRVRAIEIRPVEHNSVLAYEISDSTGDLTALFYGRARIAGVICGSLIRLRGPVGMRDGHPVMINPAYELVSSGGGQ